jgi:Flp pilus assembly protein TadG
MPTMPGPAQPRARRRWWHDDHGESSVQMAILFPFVLLVTLAVIQASLWYYARQIALTAAREGVTAARAYQATPADGALRARDVLTRTAGDSLLSPAVSTAGTTPERVRIQVTGTAPSLLPGVSGLRIAQEASGPIERWVPAP